MAKQTRSRLSYRKSDRKRTPAKKKTGKIAPVLISDKSKAIKKAPAKRGRKKTAPIKEAVIRVVRNSNGRLSSRTISQIAQSATEETEQSTPDIEVKVERPGSPSVFANSNPFLLQQILGEPTSTIVTTTSSSNASGVHSQSVSSSINARANPFGRIVNFQPISSSSQCQGESQDNYLNFILSGSQTDTKKTSDCGIQCAIIEQQDNWTLTPPIISEFDLLDEMFLSEVADRLNINRQAVIEVSQDVLTEFVLGNNLPIIDEVDDDAEEHDEVTFNNALTYGNSFDYEYPDDVTGNCDSLSPTESIISGTPPNHNYYQ